MICVEEMLLRASQSVVLLFAQIPLKTANGVYEVE